MSSDDALESEILVATLLCPLCESELSPGVTSCQRCGSATVNPAINPFQAPAGSVPKDIDAGTASATAIVSIALTVGLIGVLVAVGISSPGVAICLALMTIPPWIRTTLVVWRRSKTGLPTSHLSKASLLFGSVMITWLILFVSLVSCLLTFCIACFGAIVVAETSQVAASTILIVTFVGTFLLILAAFSPWIKGRWNRDVTRGK